MADEEAADRRSEEKEEEEERKTAVAELASSFLARPLQGGKALPPVRLRSREGNDGAVPRMGRQDSLCRGEEPSLGAGRLFTRTSTLAKDRAEAEEDAMAQQRKTSASTTGTKLFSADPAWRMSSRRDLNQPPLPESEFSHRGVANESSFTSLQGLPSADRPARRKSSRPHSDPSDGPESPRDEASCVVRGEDEPSAAGRQWRTLSWHKRSRRVLPSVLLGTRDAAQLSYPGLLGMAAFALPLSFFLVSGPGRSLLSGFLLHGRLELEVPSCDESAVETSCAMPPALEGVADKPTLTSLGQNVNFVAFQSYVFLSFIGATLQLYYVTRLIFRGRTRDDSWKLQTYIVLGIGFMLLVGGAFLNASRPGYESAFWLNPFYFLQPMFTFAFSQYSCNENKRPLLTRGDMLWFIYTTAVAVCIPSLLGRGIPIAKSAGIHPMSVIALGVIFAEAGNALLLHAVAQLPRFSIGLVTVVLFAMDFGSKIAVRTYIVASSTEVIFFGGLLQAILEVLLATVKRVIFDGRLLDHNADAPGRHLLLRASDVTAQGVADILSTFAVVPVRLMVDPRLFDAFGSSACAADGNLATETLNAVIMLVWALGCVLGTLYFQGLWYGPTGLRLEKDGSKLRELQLYILGVVIVSFATALEPNRRQACIFCYAEDAVLGDCVP